MKIISLEASNVKRLRAVSIKPDGSMVIVGGNNGHGKTSTLDSIWMALGGESAIPPKPVREGEKEAAIKLDLGDFVVTRTIQPDGKSTLKVVGKDGGKYSSPQTILNGLVEKLSFDPLEFSRMDPKKQLDTLRGLVGVDFSPLERRKAAKTEERLMVGREVKALQGQLQGMPQYPDAPPAEVSIAELSDRLSLARVCNQSKQKLRENMHKTNATSLEWAQRVIDLEAELTEAKQQAKIWEGKSRAAQKELNSAKDVDEKAILDQMGNADMLNRKVRGNSERIRVSSQLDQKQAAYETLTADIEAIGTEKRNALARAKFPVPGLSFDENGVLVNGLPFQQASGAEQLKISVGMGLSLNPKLKVLLVRDGSLLDADSLAMVAEMAAAADGQVWIERVSDGDAGAIVIEDGAVRK